MIPVGTTVEILPFVENECMNRTGEVVRVCQHQCCTEQGETFVCTEYTVRYRVSNCHQCQIVETLFCEKDLNPLTTTP